jgi:hypothetical protein
MLVEKQLTVAGLQLSGFKQRLLREILSCQPSL